MSTRRMFSIKITNSAKFLRMPIDSQLLYFHLGLHADDDGIVEAYTVLKMLGSQEDNLKVLSAKGFVKVLNEDLVSFITDWNEHNLIRPDRKVDSIYKNLLLKLVPEVEVLEAKPRADTGKTTGRPMDNQMSAQVRLGKDRIGEVREGNNTETSSVEVSSIIKAFEVINPASKKFYGNTTQRGACQSLMDTYTLERVLVVIEKTLPKTNKLSYFPTITTPLQLFEKWSTLESAIIKHKQGEKPKRTIV